MGRSFAFTACAMLSASACAYSLAPHAVQQRSLPIRPALRVASIPMVPTVPSVAKRAAEIRMEEVVKETTTRSLVKAIGWRFTAGVVTAMTSFFFTGSLAMAASIVGWDLCR